MWINERKREVEVGRDDTSKQGPPLLGLGRSPTHNYHTFWWIFIFLFTKEKSSGCSNYSSIHPSVLMISCP
jgi:hypothetical protein